MAPEGVTTAEAAVACPATVTAPAVRPGDAVAIRGTGLVDATVVATVAA